MCKGWQDGDYEIHEYPGMTRGPLKMDKCIAPILNALNAYGIRTTASCCGHGVRPGSIILADGREFIIAPDYDTARVAERAFPPLNVEGAGPPVPRGQEEVERLRYALQNCYVLAVREARKEQKADNSRSSRWNHIIRLCKDADTDGSICDTGGFLRELPAPVAALAQADEGRLEERCPLCMGHGRYGARGNPQMCGVCKGTGKKAAPALAHAPQDAVIKEFDSALLTVERIVADDTDTWTVADLHQSVRRLRKQFALFAALLPQAKPVPRDEVIRKLRAVDAVASTFKVSGDVSPVWTAMHNAIRETITFLQGAAGTPTEEKD